MQHESSNGLALADTLALANPLANQSDFEVNSSDDSGSGSDASSADELPDTDREDYGEDRNQLFEQLFEMNQASKFHDQLAPLPPDPAKHSEHSEHSEHGLSDGEIDPDDTLGNALDRVVLDSPLDAPNWPQIARSSPLAGLQTPKHASPRSIHSTPEAHTAASEAESDVDRSLVIDETPSELHHTKVVDLWCKVAGNKWRPGYRLEDAGSGDLLVRIAGNEEPVTIRAQNTRPLDLEIGTGQIKIWGETDIARYRVLDLIKDPQASFTTPSDVARLELERNGKPSVVGLDQIYWQELTNLERSPKRPRLAAKPQTQLFKDCVFLLTGISEDDDDQGLVRGHIKINGGQIEHSILEHINPETLEWEGPDIKFGAVLAVSINLSNKIVEAQATGWPVLSFTYVQACISAGTLVNVDKFLLKRPFKQCATMEQQYMTRQLALGSVVPPVYLLSKTPDTYLARLVSVCLNKQVRAVCAERDIPEGSLVIDAENREALRSMHVSIQHALSRQLLLEDTVTMSKSWLFRTIVDRKIN